VTARARRWRSLGLRREVLILVPASFFLVILLSVFALLSHRNAVSLLVEERRAEAASLAGRLAGEISTDPDPAARLRELAPAARGAALLGADGEVLSRAGTLPEGPLLAPLGQAPEPRTYVLGPGEDLEGVVAAFVPLGRRGDREAAGWLRIDLGAAALAAQERSLVLLAWVVLGVDASLGLLVLLFVGHMLAPYETLLERARLAGASPTGAEDEIAFLLDTFERALEGLSGRTGEGAADDIVALQRTLGVSLESGVLLLDRTGAVLALNETGAELLGIPRPEPGTPAERLLEDHPGLATPAALIREAIASGREVRREECHINVDPAGGLQEPGGEPLERTLGLTVHPLRREEDRDGDAVRGYLVLFVDLTEVRRQREQAQLAESLRQLGELSAGVAHELRNSLATVTGYLSLIDREVRDGPGLPGEVGFSLAEIRRETGHLQRVLEDFLSFAQPGSARLEPLDLAEIAQHAAADPALGERAGAEITIERKGRVVIDGDPQLLERALRNLLHNAVAAGRETGDRRVDVIVYTSPEGPAIEVADRGPGVPPELRERLFEPFATSRAEGVGLGLALARRIILLHGAKLEIRDRPGGGTVARALFSAGDSATKGNNRPA